jgi:ankyrin repeat protein
MAGIPQADLNDKLLQAEQPENKANAKLFKAIARDNGTLIEDLVKNGGADIEAYNSRGYTPLHEAAQQGKEKAVYALIRNKADVTSRTVDEDRMTALHLGTLSNNTMVLAHLLMTVSPKDRAIPDAKGRTPLMLAVQNGFENLALDTLSGEDLELATSDGRTALHHAVDHSYENICRRLLYLGAKVLARDNDGWTPLHIAASHGKIAIVKLLLKWNADPDAETNDGRTPLDLAEENNFVPVVTLLQEMA